jgi:hypothetical protein
MDPSDGCEANTRSDAANCGMCGNACNAANATSTCSNGTCGLGTCNAGFGNCNGAAADGCEVNIATSPTNCGMCGRTCMLANATAGCAMGNCTVASCAMGYGNCDNNAANGCEARIATDSQNCGACGTVCGAGLSCSNGMCVADPSFRVVSMVATPGGGAGQCVDSPETQGGGAGDQRGVLAVTASTVLYSGDSSTIWLPNDSIATTNAIGRIHDAMVSDLRSGIGYFFANVGGAEPISGQAGAVTQLIEMTDQGLPVAPARAIQLSAPITLQGGSIGFYSGYGRIIVWTGTNWFQIAMPSGTVTPLVGNAPVSPLGCESWAHSGIAEFFGGEQYVVFMGPSGVTRQRISNGVTTVIQMLSPGDVCSISISPTRNRWYSQFEAQPSYSSIFGERVVMCPATWDSP